MHDIKAVIFDFILQLRKQYLVSVDCYSSTSDENQKAMKQNKGDPPVKDASEVEGVQSTKELLEAISQVSEKATERCGFVFDEKSGLYYEKQSGLYYDQVLTVLKECTV